MESTNGEWYGSENELQVVAAYHGMPRVYWI